MFSIGSSATFERTLLIDKILHLQCLKNKYARYKKALSVLCQVKQLFGQNYTNFDGDLFIILPDLRVLNILTSYGSQIQ